MPEHFNLETDLELSLLEQYDLPEVPSFDPDDFDGLYVFNLINDEEA